MIHYLITFFKSTLTVPKLKDLVNMPIQKYEAMYNIINNAKTSHLDIDNNYKTKGNSDDSSYTLIDLLPKQDTNMKNELKSFLKSQLHGNNGNNQNSNNHIEYTNINDIQNKGLQYNKSEHDMNLNTYENSSVSYSSF